ncbi:MAG: VOC family protein [Actinobacteria bacterium]|nr:VOC family protein [Actinomycetota bacterium]
MIRRLQHVSTPYPAGREEEVRSFYGGVLGLREKAVPASLAGRGLVWFEAGEDERELHFLPGPPPDPAAMRHFCLEVEDVAALRAGLAEAGHELTDDTAIPNRPRVFLRDPFGNLVELTTIEGGYE